jgi:MFS superfamily sulfate permease-like transporter
MKKSVGIKALKVDNDFFYNLDNLENETKEQEEDVENSPHELQEWFQENRMLEASKTEAFDKLKVSSLSNSVSDID